MKKTIALVLVGLVLLTGFVAVTPSAEAANQPIIPNFCYAYETGWESEYQFAPLLKNEEAYCQWIMPN